MNEPSLIVRQRLLLRDLVRIAAEKAETEPELAHSFRSETQQAEQEFSEQREAIEQRFRTEQESLDQQLQQSKQATESRFASEQDALKRWYGEARQKLTEQLDTEKEEAESAVQEAQWTADALLEGAKNDAARKQREQNTLLGTQMDQLHALFQQGRSLLEQWKQPSSEIEKATSKQAKADKRQPREIEEYLAVARIQIAGLQQLVVPHFLNGKRLIGITFLLFLALVVPLGWLASRLIKREMSIELLAGLGGVASACVSILVCWLAYTILRSIARKQTQALYRPLCEVRLDAEPVRQQLVKRYQAEHDQAVADAEQRHGWELGKVQALEKKLQEVNEQRGVEFARLQERLQNQRKASEQRRADGLRAAEQKHKQGAAHMVVLYEADMQQREADHRVRLAEIESLNLAAWQSMVESWQQGLSLAQKSIAEINGESSALFPAWDDPIWEHWQPPTTLHSHRAPLARPEDGLAAPGHRAPLARPEDGLAAPGHRAPLARPEDGLAAPGHRAPLARPEDGLAAPGHRAPLARPEDGLAAPGHRAPLARPEDGLAALPLAMRFGSYAVHTESVVKEEPWAEDRPTPTARNLVLPALCAFPETGSLFLHAQDEGRDQASAALRAVMFRLLTSLPPGRIRFLIVDPVGLGQNFAAFMNLADQDESLVGSRIWTEATQIEQRLADLTAHMENVIQKYLRNRYATISEYNTHAGEVAEPFRVLVVANFPANFTTEAARRLVSIAQSGPRCGVSTLISIDTRLSLPRDFDVSDLERCGSNLLWEQDRFNWRDEDFAPYPLTIDPVPADNFANRILHQVGEGARNAQRVEVPFEFIAPVRTQWWSGSSRQGISVALGRAGATRRQHLELGKGTSQHALIVGKTGSGKSTLFHALITNLALAYSPDEVELYLVDFKKGVEFKTYATHNLPHARVIAIESEREFGLSVLQRLDAELRNRGERFRAVGAQGLDAFRQAMPEARSPRVMLIVDEFQEFFVDDDRIAQEASQLLDRLVRQGRAFGMHILLGSQTIGGAYSLARSTIDQMAVRIALQCSEADAHLVLSDDNSAARLLSRPGEAIYNNANGLVEGNDPFQVVWLNDAQREQYLNSIHDLAEQRPLKQRPATVVFEGNASADVTKNHLLNQLLAAAPQPDDSAARAEAAWLGEAMAIDELTAAVFRRQNGSNLLIVGQQPEAALGMLITGIISLAAHAPQGDAALPRFYVVDGSQADPPSPRSALSQLPDVVSAPVRVVGWRDLPAVMTELAADLEHRQSAPNADAPSAYLILYGIHRMRDLRRSEDDFGFGRSGEQAATPDKQLATLLREGAGLGMHTLIWCDTVNNLNRAIDRSTMRELAMRVVFQLSVADSSNLIDNPAASKLGMHRALFANEEDGRLEKFRPYGPPDEEWLAWVREEFKRRKAPSAHSEVS